MQHALVGVGVTVDEALAFINRVYLQPNSTSFCEMYGQGSIVAEANHHRRSLNLKGLHAFDLRTKKPNGDSWDFNQKADRQMAKAMIDESNPDWIIGSPPCTAFSIWNRQMNYRKMPVDKVRVAIEEGKRHLNFVCM